MPKAAEASVKALRYAAAVEEGLCVKLGGDLSYPAFTVKNPLCSYWTVQTWQDELYDLAGSPTTWTWLHIASGPRRRGPLQSSHHGAPCGSGGICR